MSMQSHSENFGPKEWNAHSERLSVIPAIKAPCNAESTPLRYATIKGIVVIANPVLLAMTSQSAIPQDP